MEPSENLSPYDGCIVGWSVCDSVNKCLHTMLYVLETILYASHRSTNFIYCGSPQKLIRSTLTNGQRVQVQSCSFKAIDRFNLRCGY